MLCVGDCVIRWNSLSKQVLQFNNEASRYRFVKKLTKLLKSKGKNLKRHEDTESNVYQRAVTKEKRQEMLSNFFKKVFAEVLSGNIIIIPNVLLTFNYVFLLMWIFYCFKVYNVHELGPNCNVEISDPADMADCQLSRVGSILRSFCANSNPTEPRRKLKLMNYLNLRSLL